jgi:hypothetical protein
MTTVSEVTALVGGPGDDVRYARRDLLVAARAAVRLKCTVCCDMPDLPQSVRRGLDSLDASPRPVGVQLNRRVAASNCAWR